MKTNFTTKLILLCTSALLCVKSHAQVTIGSNTYPEPYEILRIDGNDDKGLRLSRLTQTERDDLTNTTISISSQKKDAAKGLTIYNITYNRIEFWDGNEWRILSGSFSFSNGLNLLDTANPQKARLGGTLIEETLINQQSHTLAFKTEKGALSINTDAFFVDSLRVKANNIDRFYIDTVLTVDNRNEISINTGKSGLYVNNSVLNIINDQTKINGHLQYKDGNENLAVAGKDIILRAKDNTGKANWEQMEPSVLNKPFTINRVSGSPNGPSGTKFTVDTWTEITDNQILPAGKWLIFGRFAAYSNRRTDASSGDNANYMSFLRLVREDSGGDVVLYSSMTLPERKTTGGNENYGSYSVPQMVYFLDAANAASYRIDFKTKKPDTWHSTHSMLGDQYFYAIRLND
ncbi:hypothetical protein [uncultured Dysgonomonas sp.]|uniref:Uncharacterized protein n=1 Tax=uncultured Dysgonomonas sp. TaxID=206096 RepID=A0A212J188_9BACT|nr:hypothetical protein [uncultured Dysgonomonas sp.]SBV93201.1 conserved exported hypothetical protein [uncultured Dysgonomonas sp.]